jgi:hypothetical protein
MRTGESFFLLLPNLQAASVEIFLREFAAAQGLGKEKMAVLLWDGAPAHRACLKIPEGIALDFNSSLHAGVESKRAVMVTIARNGSESFV